MAVQKSTLLYKDEGPFGRSMQNAEIEDQIGRQEAL
jgi:hypothetical protein